MTEMTNPAPQDPAGPSAMDESSSLASGSEQLLDGGSTGTDDGPAGLPASLVGHDKDGDPVDAPPAARPDGATGGTTSTGPAEEADPLSPSDTSTPSSGSAGRSDSAAGTPLGDGRS
jgi:hypothetical protein